MHANQEFRDVADFFASVRYLHIVPQLVREPDRSVGRRNDPFGGDFLEQIARTPENAAVVAALEQRYDTFTAAREGNGLLSDIGEVPSGEEIGAELERFLAEQGREDPTG